MAIEISVVQSDLNDCSALAGELSPAAASFIRRGWNVEPLPGLEGALAVSPLCWTIWVDGIPAGMFGCASGGVAGVGRPWLVTAPSMEMECVRFRFIRHSRQYVREMFGLFPVLAAHVYRGNKPLIQWMGWIGFSFVDIDEWFLRGEVRQWDCPWA